MSEIIIKLHKLHPAQQTIIDQSKRFNVLKCGRRFGKTDLIKELSSIALDGKFIGIWSPTYKDLHEVWKELLFVYHDVIQSKNEQVKQVVLITGGIIDMWSMEDPNSGRGRKYHRAIIDEAEKARNLKDCWEQTIRATLVDYTGDAWFMSTPKFGMTYFKNTLFTNKDKFDNWNSWRFTSYDNPFLPMEEVDAAKAQLDDLTFRCEYMADDVDVTARPFAYCFDESVHCVSDLKYDPMLELMISFDFNVQPITCITAQYDGNTISFLKSFSLQNSNIYDLCDSVVTEYGHLNPLYLVTGDATGRARTAMVKGNINYYYVIREKLNLSDSQIKTPRSNPAISDSRVLMNSLFQHYDILIDKDNCKELIYDLKYVQVDEHGDIEKDRSTDAKNADQIDCARYLFSTFFQWFIKANKNSLSSQHEIDTINTE